MLEKNMGQTDRIIRAIVGVVMVIAFLSMSGFWSWLALIIGVVLLATAAMAHCPPYSMLGINTCSTKQS